MLSVSELRRIWDETKRDFDIKKVGRSEGRGMLRRETTLSHARLRALLKGQYLEVTLERTILALLDDIENNYRWGNQFNIAGGLGGGNTEASDLCREGEKDRVFDLIELKGWKSRDQIHKTVEQVYRYFCKFWALALRNVAPFDGLVDCLVAVRLWVLAPTQYLRPGRVSLNQILGRKFGLPGMDQPEGLFKQVSENLEALKTERPELAKVSFQPNEILLDSAIGRQQFIDCFDPEKIKPLVDSNQDADSALDVLLPSKECILRDWVQNAMIRAGVMGKEEF
jgi:hypothetical protein